MLGPLAIRRAQVANLPSLTQIRRNAILGLASIAMGDEGAKNWADSASADRVRRAIEQHEVWLSEQGDSPNGWVEVHQDRIEGLYVSPDSSGRGVGSALMSHAEDHIRCTGHTTASLDASPNAAAFYLRRGYQLQGERSANGSSPMRKSLGTRRLASGS